MGRKKGLTYPDIWHSGPDQVDHDLWVSCLRARAQAWFRGEQWQLTELEYRDLWRANDAYLLKGRSRDSVCMTRLDDQGPWSLDNVHIITRLAHFRRSGAMRSA